MGLKWILLSFLVIHCSFITASSSVSNIEKVLHVKFYLNGTTFYTDRQNITFHGAFVHGLHNRAQSRKRQHTNRRRGLQAGAPFTPNEIRTAYGLSTQFQGNGQTSAVAELDSYVAADIEAYTSLFGITSGAFK